MRRNRKTDIRIGLQDLLAFAAACVFILAVCGWGEIIKILIGRAQ